MRPILSTHVGEGLVASFAKRARVREDEPRWRRIEGQALSFGSSSGRRYLLRVAWRTTAVARRATEVAWRTTCDVGHSR